MTYVNYLLNTSSLRPINVAFAKPDPIYWPAKQSNIKEKRCITLEGNPSHTRAFIPSYLESLLDLIAKCTLASVVSPHIRNTRGVSLQAPQATPLATTKVVKICNTQQLPTRIL